MKKQFYRLRLAFYVEKTQMVQQASIKSLLKMIGSFSETYEKCSGESFAQSAGAVEYIDCTSEEG